MEKAKFEQGQAAGENHSALEPRSALGDVPAGSVPADRASSLLLQGTDTPGKLKLTPGRSIIAMGDTGQGKNKAVDDALQPQLHEPTMIDAGTLTPVPPFQQASDTPRSPAAHQPDVVMGPSGKGKDAEVDKALQPAAPDPRVDAGAITPVTPYQWAADTGSREDPGISTDEARKIFDDIQKVDASTIDTLDSLSTLPNFLGALDVITRRTIVDSRGKGLESTSTNHYTNSWKDEDGENHLLSVTYIPGSTMQHLHDGSSIQERKQFIQSRTPHSISLSSTKGEVERFSFRYNYNNKVGEFAKLAELSVRFDDNRTIYIDSDPREAELSKPEDYEVAVRGMQQCARILSEWEKTLPSE